MYAPEPCPLGKPGGPVWTGYLTDEDETDRTAVLRRDEEPGIGYGLSKPDRLEVVRQLTERGRSARQIALTLGTAERTIVRYRQQIERKRS
jgi:DNA-binding NarL/FixJ family response regulator